MAIKRLLLSMADKSGITAKIPRTRIDAFLRKHANKGRTLDLGGGDKPYKKYFPNSVSVDIEKTLGVDIVADAHDLHQIRDNEFDCILCTEVLEHLRTPEKAISEMYRVLKSGGELILTTRFIFPLHNIPGDYFRYTRYGLEHLMKQFKTVEITEEAGTIETIAVLFERLAFQTDTLWWKPFSFFWLLLSKCTLLFKWLLTREYGDITRKEKTHSILSSGYYVRAVK